MTGMISESEKYELFKVMKSIHFGKIELLKNRIY